MSDPRAILDQRLQDAIRAALASDAPDDVQSLIMPAKNPEFGDFQSNAAMPLAKATRSNPRELAQRIVDQLDIDDLCEPPTIAGPGFINFRLKPEALARALDALDDETLGVPPLADDQRETVVVDLCGVNLAKEMHVGHLRSTVIGDAIARLHERLGHVVVRQNHFGDWGLPIAMVIRVVREQLDAGEIDLDQLHIGDLERLYREAKLRSDRGRVEQVILRKYDLGPKVEAEFEDDIAAGEQFRQACGQTLVKLQSGDERTLELWSRVSDITLEACFDICRTLRANVTEEHTAGESSYRSELPGVVQDLAERSVAEESEGALIVRLDEYGIAEPCLVRKRDGGFLYATTDLAAIRRRVQELHADRVIYAVDSRQSLHFKQVFAAAIKAGYATRDGTTAELFHAAFGTVLGPDGRALKSRSGDNVKLAELVAEAVTRAKAAVAEKNPDLPEAEADAVAEDVGVGAIKYVDLSSDRIKDYVFDFDRMLAFEGNTGPYLQYAHVRVRSIFRKAAEEHGVDASRFFEPKSDGDLNGSRAYATEEPAEKTLALELLKYPAVLAQTAAHCEPHRLCTYLFDVAQSFSAFFQACPVLRAPDEATRDARLRLCALTGRILRDGMTCLGIPTPERM